MKTLGILGGMGPMATACFMERITAMTAADTDQEQIPVIVYSNTQIPDRSAYLLGRPQAENPVTALRQTAIPKNGNRKLHAADRKSTRLNSSHSRKTRMPSSA